MGVHLRMSKSSSSISSSSFPKRSLGKELCFCELEATLKWSTTTKNPRRPFLGCAKYNTQGLPYCKFFKWLDGNEVCELQVQERIDELLKKEKDVENILHMLEKREIELHKIVDRLERVSMVLSNKSDEVMQKELVLNAQEARRRGLCTLLKIYCCFVFVHAFYLVLYK
ncbi:hypothetical protein I3843_07G025600 [Carya illinoinensis]|uniref:Zinc finger GRF-type domain-containing protein n=1 Tax=Carya illinoinensis TaxID=32201 RepID=A0A922JFC8_CARIL|nr:uncharacterized protein LOC122315358 [Carya illinoinensis]KAG6702294.1 hypothetical protein I3842_07G026800 [Carya illinoinensis]KAG7969318.1 hypothetical protein I3843_07G025600 [Carya illinoinensis]